MNMLLKLGCLVLMVGSMALPASADQGYRPDPWITLKTKIALLTAEDVSGTRVNVDSVNGRVTLHGKVETAAERARAEEIAKKVEGVKEVRNLLQVVPDTVKKVTNLEDAAIQARVEGALKSDAILKDDGIRVKSVNKGVVLLSGKASSLSSHLRAIRVAGRVDGVRRVASEVESPDTMADREIWDDAEQGGQRPSGGGVKQAVSDMWITTAAKVRLMADSATPAMDINVDTDDGVVTLFGVVPTKEAKKAAGDDVMKVSGVKKVDNHLEVVPEKNQKAVEVVDDDVTKSVKDALKSHDEFKDVSVEVKNGVVRLTGTVPHQSDRLMAAVTARSSKGVRSVNNDVKVKRE